MLRIIDLIWTFSITPGSEITTSGTSKPTSLLRFSADQGEDSDVMLEENRGFLQLLQTGELADVDVVVGDQTFHCHKAILGAKSPFFKAAFVHDMKEKATGKITIDGDWYREYCWVFLLFVWRSGQSDSSWLAGLLLRRKDREHWGEEWQASSGLRSSKWFSWREALPSPPLLVLTENISVRAETSEEEVRGSALSVGQHRKLPGSAHTGRPALHRHPQTSRH